MTITRKQLKHLIKESIKKNIFLIETQVEFGIPHNTTLSDSPEVLYDAVKKFINNNPNIKNNPELQEKGNFLLRMLDNTIQKVGVRHGNAPFFEIEDYPATPEQQVTMGLMGGSMRDKQIWLDNEKLKQSQDVTNANINKQDMLKSAKYDLEKAMGKTSYGSERYKSHQSSKRDFFRDNQGYQVGDKDDPNSPFYDPYNAYNDPSKSLGEFVRGHKDRNR